MVRVAAVIGDALFLGCVLSPNHIGLYYIDVRFLERILISLSDGCMS